MLAFDSQAFSISLNKYSSYMFIYFDQTKCWYRSSYQKNKREDHILVTDHKESFIT